MSAEISARMMILSFNNNTTGITSGTGSADHSGSHDVNPGFSGIRIAHSIFSFLFSLLLTIVFSFCSFLLVIVLSAHRIVCPSSIIFLDFFTSKSSFL